MHHSTPAPKDLGASAIVLAIATVAWMGWGSAGTSGALGAAMAAGMGAGVVLALLAVIVHRRLPGIGSHAGPRRHQVNRVYATVLAAEVGFIVAGNAVLGATGHAEFVIVWTFAVMSVHFLPLGRVYRIPTLIVTGAAGCLLAAAAAALALAAAIPTGPVIGGIGGALLLCSGAGQLGRAVRMTSRHEAGVTV